VPNKIGGVVAIVSALIVLVVLCFKEKKKASFRKFGGVGLFYSIVMIR
jgi:hypothetical protein